MNHIDTNRKASINSIHSSDFFKGHRERNHHKIRIGDGKAYRNHVFSSFAPYNPKPDDDSYVAFYAGNTWVIPDGQTLPPGAEILKTVSEGENLGDNRFHTHAPTGLVTEDGWPYTK